MAERLSAEARKSALKGLPGWTETAGPRGDRPDFIFKDFNEAFGFMSRAAWWLKRTTITRNGATFTRRWKWCWRPMTPAASPRCDIELAKAMNAIAGAARRGLTRFAHGAWFNRVKHARRHFLV